MYLHFDRNKCHLQAIVGSLEEYKPSSKIMEIQSKVNELKSKLEEFQKQVIMPALEEIEKSVLEENNKFSGPKEHLAE